MANDHMGLKVEAPANDDLAQKIAEAVRDITKLRAAVAFVAVGSLPNDGKVIEDARTYQ
jgi:phenylacetate-CoA ligase